MKSWPSKRFMVRNDFVVEKRFFLRWWNINWTHKWKENRSASMQIIVYSLRIFLVNVCFKILLNICCGLFVQQPTKKNLTNSAMQYLPWTRINADFILWWISFKSDATYRNIWRMHHTAEVFSNKNQCVIAYRLSGNVLSIMHFVEWYDAQKARSLQVYSNARQQKKNKR